VKILDEAIGLSTDFGRLLIDMGPSILLALLVGGVIESTTRSTRNLFQIFERRSWLAHPAALLMAFASPL
jgi:hypothetical protein